MSSSTGLPTGEASSRSRPVALVVAILTFTNITDGYDIFVMGFVLPFLPEGFASNAEKGFLVSAGLIGMGVGSVFLAPLADRFGRRRVIQAGLLVNIAGMVACALSPNAPMLTASRFVTGVGIGIITALIFVLASETAPAARRNAAVGIVTIGFPLGSVLAGLTSASLLTRFEGGWALPFWVGAVVGVLALIAVTVVLNESKAFLRTKAADATTSDAEPEASRKPSLVQVLSGDMRERTLLLWAMYAVVLAAFYFVTTWTPQLITTETGDAATGTLVGTALSAGSLAGSLLFALIGLRAQAIHVTWVSLTIGAVGMGLFALLASTGTGVFVAAILGLAVYTGIAAITAMAPMLYPVELRATGYGSMSGVGRVGGILAPVLAGFALAVVGPTTMYAVAALPLALAAAIIVRLWWVTQRRPRGAPEALTTSDP